MPSYEHPERDPHQLGARALPIESMQFKQRQRRYEHSPPCSGLYIQGQRRTKNGLQTLLGLHGSQLHPHQLKQDALQSVIPPILSDNITYIEVVRGLLVANCVENYIRALPSWIRHLCNRYRSVGSFLRLQSFRPQNCALTVRLFISCIALLSEVDEAILQSPLVSRWVSPRVAFKSSPW